MKKIKRHNIKRNLDKELPKVTKKIRNFSERIKLKFSEGTFVNLWAFKDIVFRESIYSLVLESDDTNLIKEGMFNFVKLGINHLNLEFCSNNYFELEFEGEDYSINCSTKINNSELYDWWILLNIAVILRNEPMQEQLFLLFKNCQKNENDPFWCRSMELILMCLGKRDFEHSILSDIKKILDTGIVTYYGLAGKRLTKINSKDDIRSVFWYPIIELYYYSFINEVEVFNKKVYHYLIKKKTWIIKNNEQENYTFWIDFPLLACCAFSYDKGIIISTESDYIPSDVYQGNILKYPDGGRSSKD